MCSCYRPVAARGSDSLTLLFGGEFLVYGGEGGVCSEEEADAWLRDSGWRPLDHAPLGGPQSLIVAETA
jgi:hypothetical protein